jgi:hypothetical protein
MPMFTPTTAAFGISAIFTDLLFGVLNAQPQYDDSGDVIDEWAAALNHSRWQTSQLAEIAAVTQRENEILRRRCADLESLVREMEAQFLNPALNRRRS